MPSLPLSNTEAELVLASLISHSDHRELSARSGNTTLRLSYMRDAWLALRLARRLCARLGQESLVKVMERRAEEVAYRAGQMKGGGSVGCGRGGRLIAGLRPGAADAEEVVMPLLNHGYDAGG